MTCLNLSELVWTCQILTELYVRPCKFTLMQFLYIPFVFLSLPFYFPFTFLVLLFYFPLTVNLLSFHLSFTFLLLFINFPFTLLSFHFPSTFFLLYFHFPFTFLSLSLLSFTRTCLLIIYFIIWQKEVKFIKIHMKSLKTTKLLLGLR